MTCLNFVINFQPVDDLILFAEICCAAFQVGQIDAAPEFP
jgi:hypothetical protein